MHILLNSGPLKYFQTILVRLICPTLGVVDFLSALNLMVEKKSREWPSISTHFSFCSAPTLTPCLGCWEKKSYEID